MNSMPDSPAPLRILFVDDEPRVLEALRLDLQERSRPWQIQIADGPLAALSDLECARYDVVVSDMRMPHMDGIELLSHVKRDQPHAIRLLLSGQADHDVPRLALTTAHQLLSKPCQPDALAATIDRARALRTLIDDDVAQRIGARLQHLPTPPQLYWDLTRARSSPSEALGEMIAVIRRDNELAAKLIDLANWPYTGMARRARSLHEAAEVLGADVVRAFAVAGMLSQRPSQRLAEGFSYQRLRAHTFATARVARRLAPRPDTAARAFAAAMLIDVGQLVIAVAFADELPAILQRTGRGELLEEAQRAELGFTHAEIGAYLMGLWGLPTELIEGVADHLTLSRVDRQDLDLATLLHVASTLVDEQLPPMWRVPRPPRLDLKHLQTIGVAARMPQWQWVAAEEVAALEGRTLQP